MKIDDVKTELIEQFENKLEKVRNDFLNSIDMRIDVLKDLPEDMVEKVDIAWKGNVIHTRTYNHEDTKDIRIDNNDVLELPVNKNDSWEVIILAKKIHTQTLKEKILGTE